MESVTFSAPSLRYMCATSLHNPHDCMSTEPNNSVHNGDESMRFSPGLNSIATYALTRLIVL
jgi:hypothetical protein